MRCLVVGEDSHMVMDSRPSPPVSVISLTYNRRHQIAELLRSLQQQDYDNFEVIVVDNASTDGTAELIESEFPYVRRMRAPVNMGTFSYSLGIEAAKGVYLLMMDDDGLPAQANWIAEVVSRFEQNPQLGAVACTVRMTDTGKIAHDSPQFVPEGSLQEGYPCAAYNGTGAGLRTAAVQNLNPVYPRYFFRTWIELCLCTNLLRTGWEVRHFPGIEVWHCRPSGSSVPVLSYYGLRNYYWYVWQSYPWPYLFGETLHALVSSVRSALRGHIPAHRLWRATRDALVSAHHPFSQRRPVSRGTLAYLQGVRRQGNWHGIAPLQVPFGEPL